MLEAVNEARSTDSNCGAYGDFPAVGDVSGNANLHEAAEGHADDMANNDFFDHTGSDGHCRNIMNGGANEIGVGFAREPSSEWGAYWVLKLGRQ